LITRTAVARKGLPAAIVAVLVSVIVASPVLAQCEYNDLSVGVTYVASDFRTEYRFAQTQAKWAVIAIRPDSNDNWDLRVYGDTAADPVCFSSLQDSSLLGNGEIDLVVGDFFHTPLDTYYVSVEHVSGPLNGWLMWSDGRSNIAVNDSAIVRSMNGDDILLSWNVYLEAGKEYAFQMSYVTGNLGDAKMALFRNQGSGPFWTRRTGAEFEVNQYANYTAPASDWYGLVVTNDSRNYITYNLRVGTCTDPVPLVDGVPQTPSSFMNFYEFDQQQSGWAAFAYRGEGASKSATIYGSLGSGPWPSCLDDELDGFGTGGPAAILMGNFNDYPSPPGTFYARAVMPAGVTSPRVEWDGTSGSISVDGPPVTDTFAAGNIVEVWDVDLTGGQMYSFHFVPVGGAEMRLYAMAPSADGWSTSTSYAFQTDKSRQWVAQETGKHGLAVANLNGGHGTYKLGISTCSLADTLEGGAGSSTPPGDPSARFRFLQGARRWAAIGVQSAENWNLSLYEDPCGSSPPECFSGLLIESSYSGDPLAIDFIAGDFHRNPLGEYYVIPWLVPMVTPPLALVEWERGGGVLSTNADIINWDTGPGDFLGVWEVFFIAGYQYDVIFVPSGVFDVKLHIFRPSGETYWGTRSDSELETSSSTTYLATYTGYHGVVATNDDGGTGFCKIGFASPTLSIGPVSQPWVASIRALVPNPTAGPLAIHFDTPGPADIGFEIVDVAGRLIARLPAEHVEAGSWTRSWNGFTGSGDHSPVGVYFVRIYDGDHVSAARKFVISH
jgi:hypothetical protein